MSDGVWYHGAGMWHKNTVGHLLVLITIFIWGTTFISTKTLLSDLRPVEILFLRFAIALPALWLVKPRRLRGATWQQELYFAAAGLCGICLYYLLENIALTYTQASNVGVIISTSPFFTALLSGLFIRGERLHLAFFIGFVVAMVGISLISFGGSGGPRLSPTGDILALAAAFTWACYSVLIKKISSFGHSALLTTRRVFFYGLLFMLPAMYALGFAPDWACFARPVCLANILYLGLGASALCFVTWSYAVELLGPVKPSLYIYLIPVITVIMAVLLLGESLSHTALIGIALTLAGLLLSERRHRR